MKEEIRQRNATKEVIASRFHHVPVAQHGVAREIISTLGSCENCIARDHCEEYIKAQSEGKEYLRIKTCPAVKNIYLRSLRDLGDVPTYMMKKLAELETQMKLKELQDGSNKEISKEYLKLVELRLDYFKALTTVGLLDNGGFLKSRLKDLDEGQEPFIDLEDVNLDEGVVE